MTIAALLIVTSGGLLVQRSLIRQQGIELIPDTRPAAIVTALVVVHETASNAAAGSEPISGRAMHLADVARNLQKTIPRFQV